MESSNFLWFTWISKHVTHANIHIVHGVVVFLFLLVTGVLYKRSLNPIDQELIPTGQVSLKNVVQAGIQSLFNLVKGAVPHHTEEYFPLLCAIFIYVFCSNLLGVLPGFLPPTESINTNLAVAITVFVYYHAVGIKKHGLKKYCAHFLVPDLGKDTVMVVVRYALIPIFILIEIISHCVRPVTLSLRLFGNISGDHLVWKTFADLVPPLVPVAFLCFGVFVAFIQAFVFTLLSSIYVGLAVDVDENH
jgi:F-type H+-transporting ATPase subunit a